jgi:hypothetical protein
MGFFVFHPIAIITPLEILSSKKFIINLARNPVLLGGKAYRGKPVIILRIASPSSCLKPER